MAKKDEIIYLYYEKKMRSKAISEKISVSTAYITKIIKCDFRYDEEKNCRKKESKIKKRGETMGLEKDMTFKKFGAYIQ